MKHLATVVLLGLIGIVVSGCRGTGEGQNPSPARPGGEEPAPLGQTRCSPKVESRARKWMDSYQEFLPDLIIDNGAHNMLYFGARNPDLDLAALQACCPEARFQEEALCADMARQVPREP